MANLKELRNRVQSVLHEAGVDPCSQVFFSTDPVIANLMPLLDRSEEKPPPGVTKRIHPFGLGSRREMRNEIVLQPGAKVRWHCHPLITVWHTVVAGHVIVERLVKRNGKPVRGPNGLVREQKRLNCGDSWRAPPGEPYAYWAEDEPARTNYDHEDDPACRPAKGCVDPEATPEKDDVPEASAKGRRKPRGAKRKAKPS